MSKSASNPIMGSPRLFVTRQTSRAVADHLHCDYTREKQVNRNGRGLGTDDFGGRRPVAEIGGGVMTLSQFRYDAAPDYLPVSIGKLAGEGNRTLVSSLGSWRSTIELHPQKNPFDSASRRSEQV